MTHPTILHLRRAVSGQDIKGGAKPEHLAGLAPYGASRPYEDYPWVKGEKAKVARNRGARATKHCALCGREGHTRARCGHE